MDIPLMCSVQVLEFNNEAERTKAELNLKAMALPNGFTISTADV